MSSSLIKKIWQLKEAPPQEFLKQFPEYSPLTTQLLWERNLHTQKAIDEFFNPDWESDVHDPFLLKDMDRGVKRLLQALDAKEKIAIWGDYDADGVCGAAILYSFFRAVGASAEVYIPDRFTEGYGVSQKGVDDLARGGSNLVITVDCGIVDHKGLARVKEHGMDSIVLDHHEPEDTLPPACAVLDHKRHDDQYPFKGLCGAGMAFKFVQAVIRTRDFGLPVGWEKWLLDLVAIATVFDRVPLLGENRTLVHYGLLVLAQNRRPGLKAMFRQARFSPQFDKSTLSGNVTAETIGFLIAPRLNAMGRLKHATNSFQLLVSDSESEVAELAKDVEFINKKRQDLTAQITKEAEELVQAQVGDPIFFLHSPQWSSGLVGIVAGHLTEKYHKPAFILGGAGELYQGSVRSVLGFDVVEAIHYAKSVLESGGGHKMSAGFSVRPENLEKARRLFLEYAHAHLNEQMLQKVLDIDIELSGGEINWELIGELQSLEPSGEANNKPLCLVRGMRVTELRKVGNGGGHLKFKFSKQISENEIKEFSGVGFKMGNGYMAPEHELLQGDIIDIVCTLEVNEFRGRRTIELHVKDWRKTEDK